jgi:predicted RNase H-like HicB family nuclease
MGSEHGLRRMAIGWESGPLIFLEEKLKRYNIGNTGRRKTMNFLVTIDRDEDGAYIAECTSIPGCVSQGCTEEEALRNIKDAIRECLEARAELGMPLTITTRQVEISV